MAFITDLSNIMAKNPSGVRQWYITTPTTQGVAPPTVWVKHRTAQGDANPHDTTIGHVIIFITTHYLIHFHSLIIGVICIKPQSCGNCFSERQSHKAGSYQVIGTFSPHAHCRGKTPPANPTPTCVTHVHLSVRFNVKTVT